MITKEQALTEDEFHEPNGYNHCRRWRRNGKTKTWKRDLERYRLPIKHGLYTYDAITNANSYYFHLASECPNK